jgi:hypothetical protein
MKPMDFVSGQGANRSDTRRYREDWQRSHGAKDAVSLTDIYETAHQARCYPSLTDGVRCNAPWIRDILRLRVRFRGTGYARNTEVAQLWPHPHHRSDKIPIQTRGHDAEKPRQKDWTRQSARA